MAPGSIPFRQATLGPALRSAAPIAASQRLTATSGTVSATSPKPILSAAALLETLNSGSNSGDGFSLATNSVTPNNAASTTSRVSFLSEMGLSSTSGVGLGGDGGLSAAAGATTSADLMTTWASAVGGHANEDEMVVPSLYCRVFHYNEAL